MKQIKVKRLVYTNERGAYIIGAEEYDYALTDHNILGSVHELGRTEWIDNSLWMLQYGIPVYRITVETFYRYQKRWYELLLDTLRRI